MESTDKKEFRLQALRTALESGTMRGIHRMINALHPAEIASLLESLPPARREVVWELVDPEDEGEVLVELNDEVRANLISGMDADELVAAMEGMELDDLADIMGDLPEAVNRQVLRSLEQQDRERLRAVLAYPEDTAGGLMNTDTVTVRPDVVLEVVLRYLRARGGLPERTDQLFVVDRNDEYLGSLAIGQLLTQDPQRTVAELMDTSIEAINANLPEAEVASIFEDRDLLSAAVVDDNGALLGRITIDDVVDVIRDQADHSMMRMAGLDEDEDMFAPVIKSARRRAVWLGVNLATAFLAAWVVGLFQATIEKVVVLAVLMPIVASMGGIAGSQTLTLVIRGMALGQVARSNAQWLIFKEIAVGLLNGLGWALVVALAVVLWFRTWEVGAIIAAALVINLLIAAIAGVGIPLVLKRLRIDPALAGTVILTTVTDVIGFMAFLGLGAFFLT
ncbi:MAG TPA: magnesium transporter [Gammaproteobacteria bacterium]|nr:magnesium transporter [Gammaproteobacteria bacterium]